MIPSPAGARYRHLLRMARHVLVLVACAMVFLSSMVAAAYAAGPLDERRDLMAQATDVPAGIPEDPVVEEPVVEPTEAEPLPTETPADLLQDDSQPPDATSDAPLTTQEATADESQHLTINVYRCDHPTFDPSFSSNFQLVINECVGPGSGTFSIDSSIPVAPQTGSVLEFQIGEFLYIRGQVQPGYDDPIVNCFVLDPNDNALDQIGPAEASGGDWKVPNDDNDVHCDWYQVDRGLGVVYIVNMACPGPPGFPTPTLDQLIATCKEPAGPIQFGVQHGQIYSETVTSSGEFNDAFFDELSTGPIAIWAEPPQQVESARMFCQVNTIEGVEISPFAEVPVADFRATSLTLAHDQRLHCSWFNIPKGPGVFDPGPPPTPTPLPGVADIPEGGGVLDPGTVPTPTATPPGGASEFRVRLHTCPVGYDPLAVGVDPNIDCSPGPNGVTFTLADQDPDTPDLQSMTGDSIDNTVTFGGLTTDSYTVTETVPDGIGSMFVLGCGGGGGIDPIPVVVNGPLQVSVPAGVIQTCRWFNVPGLNAIQKVASAGTPGVAAAITGTGSLTMYKYNCPAGFDVSAVDTNPQAFCTLAKGVLFDMDNSIDDNAGWMFETGNTGTGYNTVDGLAADTYTIAEYVRNGTTATFVWDCYDLAGSSSRTDPLVLGSKLIYKLAEGAQVRCDWFNVTGATGRVIVNKHACGILVPAYTLSLEQLDAQCGDDPGTIDFTVVSDTHQETQPASKTPLVLASFANVPSGYVSVVEDLPDGWGTPIVYCQVNLEDATNVSPPTLADVIQGRQISFPLEPGQVVYCDWFNVTGGFVDVHVTKRACPQGFDAYGADQAAFASSCLNDPGMVDFTVEDGGLYLQTKPANGAASAVFEDVPSGSLRVTETLPATQGLPVVYCSVDFEDGSNVLPAEKAPVVGGEGPSIVRELSAGQVLRCDWYNVPGGLGKVSMWKQACPAGFDAYSATRHELELSCDEDFESIDFSLTSGSFSDTASSTNQFPYADFASVPTVEVTVTETLPRGFGQPVVYCTVQEKGKPPIPREKVDVAIDTSITWRLEPNQWLICQWYNVPETDSTVTVVKWVCPEGTTYDKGYDFYSANCTQAHEGVDFKLTHGDGSAPGTTGVNGQIQWADVPLGPFSIQEYIPKDYGEPIVFCSAGSDVAFAQLVRMDTPGGYLESELTMERTIYTCHWFNIYGGPGEITVHKHTCPSGYDLHAAGANPMVDCATKTNGVPFTLKDSDPATEDLAQLTGASVDGAVSYGDLTPGAYTVTETVPPETRFVFVLDCSGGKMGAVRSYPLSTGEVFTVEVGAGESIVCHWYNVPEYEQGRLTVVKYQCSTMTWVSDVDCQIYEDGQTFDLVFWNGESWEHHSTQSTDGEGQTTFVDLTPGEYWLDEQDRDWCRLTSEQISDNGNWLNVEGGQETVVLVSNCGSDPASEGKVGDIPAKYPNTGVGPDDVSPISPLGFPVFAAIAGLTFRRKSAASALEARARPGEEPVDGPIHRTCTRRQLATGLGLPLAGSLVVGHAALGQGTQKTESSEDSPASLCLPSTPTAGGEDQCLRGPVPFTLRIDAIGVDAPVEILETVGGVMQQPSDEVHVAWYKDCLLYT